MTEEEKKYKAKLNEYGYYENEKGEWEYFPSKDKHKLVPLYGCKDKRNLYMLNESEDDYGEESFP